MDRKSQSCEIRHSKVETLIKPRSPEDYQSHNTVQVSFLMLHTFVIYRTISIYLWIHICRYMHTHSNTELPMPSSFRARLGPASNLQKGTCHVLNLREQVGREPWAQFYIWGVFQGGAPFLFTFLQCEKGRGGNVWGFVFTQKTKNKPLETL